MATPEHAECMLQMARGDRDALAATVDLSHAPAWEHGQTLQSRGGRHGARATRRWSGGHTRPRWSVGARPDTPTLERGSEARTCFGSEPCHRAAIAPGSARKHKRALAPTLRRGSTGRRSSVAAAATGPERRAAGAAATHAHAGARERAR
jgi:hypothetical protein